MPHRFPGEKVNPYLGILLHGWIGDEGEGVAVLDLFQMFGPITEDRPMDGGAEVAGVFGGEWGAGSGHHVG